MYAHKMYERYRKYIHSFIHPIYGRKTKPHFMDDPTIRRHSVSSSTKVSFKGGNESTLF
jgi:hypothetical protein